MEPSAPEMTEGNLSLVVTEPRDLLELVSKVLDDNKAENTVVIDLAGKSSIADYMVIATGRSSRQVSALAQYLREAMKKAGVRGVTLEGEESADWVLIDGGDVIVHVFRPEVREFYNLEKMWTVPSSSVQLAGEA